MSDPNVSPNNASQSNSSQREQPKEIQNGEQAAAGAEPMETADAGDAQQELARIEAELQEANNRALRAHAELENFRKRIRREMDEERRYANLHLIRDLLLVVDNLQRAIESAEQNQESAGLLQGVKMVAAQLEALLEQHHCQRIEAAGEPFDPNLHEAIGQQPSSEHPPGTVTRVTRAGYRLHDRVIRPSQVFVSTAGPDQDEQPVQQT